MHWTRLAPELSATSSMVRIWIMARSLLYVLLDDARHQKALVATDRTVLLNLVLVANLELIRLVVRLVSSPGARVLPVDGIAPMRDRLHAAHLCPFLPY